MCLSRPARVICVDGMRATVVLNGQTMQIDTRPIGRVEVGEHVLVHAGLALERIDPATVAELEALLSELESMTAEWAGSVEEVRHVST